MEFSACANAVCKAGLGTGRVRARHLRLRTEKKITQRDFRVVPMPDVNTGRVLRRIDGEIGIGMPGRLLCQCVIPFGVVALRRSGLEAG